MSDFLIDYVLVEYDGAIVALIAGNAIGHTSACLLDYVFVEYVWDNGYARA